MRMLRLFGPALVALALVPRPSSACSCLEPPPPVTAFEEAGAVFEGLVVGLRLIGTDPPVEPFEEEARIEVEFEARQSWKGVTTARVFVQTAPNEGLCGFTFELGERYLVYTRANDDPTADPWTTDLCTRTRETRFADEDLAALSGRTIVESRRTGWGALKSLFR